MADTLTRTTILIQPALLARLKLTSKRQRKPMSTIIQEALQQVMEAEDVKRRRRMYTQMDKMIGMIKTPIQDASGKIDEVLYGQDGIWRGERD